MKSTFPVKRQQNWGLKVYLFSMGKACKRGGLFIGVFTISTIYPPYYQQFVSQYLFND